MEIYSTFIMFSFTHFHLGVKNLLFIYFYFYFLSDLISLYIH